MVQLRALLSSAGRRLDRLLVLSAIPFFVSLASPGNFARIAADTSTFRLGVSFGFPSAVATSWDFVSLPSPGSGFTMYPPNLSLVAGAALVLGSAVLTGVLSSVYLVALQDDLLGGGDGNALRYAPALVVFELLVVLVVFGLGALALVNVVLLIPGLLVALYLAYRFYPTPYLVVLDDRGLEASLKRSYELSTGRGAYAEFFVQYLVAVALVSLVATPLFTTSVVGAAVGALVLAPVCVLFNAATMLFLVDLTGSGGTETETPGGWDPDAAAVRTAT